MRVALRDWRHVGQGAGVAKARARTPIHPPPAELVRWGASEEAYNIAGGTAMDRTCAYRDMQYTPPFTRALNYPLLLLTSLR